MSFWNYWTSAVWPNIKDDFNRLLNLKPRNQEDGATGRKYGSELYERIHKQKEMRNVTCNLCWTSPSENTKLQENISLELVQNLTMDLFVVAAASAATALEDP